MFRACRSKPEGGAFASVLAIQMRAVNYKADITTEEETVNIRVGSASVLDVRRAICRQMGWLNAEGKMARFDNTLRFLRAAGITSIRIIGDAETLDIELSQNGRCKKSS